MNRYLYNFLVNFSCIKKAYRRIFTIPYDQLLPIDQDLIKHYDLVRKAKKVFNYHIHLNDGLYFYLYKLLKDHDYGIDSSILIQQIQKYQNKKYILSYLELRSIPNTLLYCCISKLSDIYRVEKKHIEDLLIVENIFSFIDYFDQFDLEKIIVNLSYCESLLLKDEIYKQMDTYTKNIYRNRIISLSKKSHLLEHKLIEKLKSDHIGYELFQHHPIQYQFLLNYVHSIPATSSTLVILHSDIHHVDDIDRLYQRLESIYITNQSDHLYFLLTSTSYLSPSLSKYILFKLQSLNEKYDQSIFYFASKKLENQRDMMVSVLAYLIDRKECFEIDYFTCINQSIHYIIMLDHDMDIIPNQLFSLIGMISHPLNKKSMNHDLVVGEKQRILSMIFGYPYTKRLPYQMIFSVLGLYHLLCHDKNYLFSYKKINQKIFYHYHLQNKKIKKNKLSNDYQEKEILNIARKTFCYFEDSMNKKIITSFYDDQEKEFSEEVTSVDIGLYFLSIIAAYEMKIIDFSEVSKYFYLLFDFIDRLPKWEGHLFQRYHTTSKRVLDNEFVSSIGSCIFIYCVMIVQGFLFDHSDEKLKSHCATIIKSADFSKFLIHHRFSVGFSCQDLELSSSVYSSESSEFYLLKYLSICKGDIEYNEALSKSIQYSSITHLVNLFLYSNYQPYIRTITSLDHLTFDSYFSLLLLDLYPKQTYRNVEYIKKMNMSYHYGFYDSYDVSTGLLSRKSSTFSQAFNLISISKYYKGNLFKNYLFRNPTIYAYQFLLNLSTIRSNNQSVKVHNPFHHLMDTYILSNPHYTILYHHDGYSLSQYRLVGESSLNLNGNYLYLCDISRQDIVSPSYYPVFNDQYSYDYSLSYNQVLFTATSSFLSIKSSSCVLQEDNLEIKKLTIVNKSDQTRDLELTSVIDLVHHHDLLFHFDYNSHLLIAEEEKQTNRINSYQFTTFVTDLEAEFSYEVDRDIFLGYGNFSNPIALKEKLKNHLQSKKLSVMALRIAFKIPPKQKKNVYLLHGFSRNEKSLMKIYHSYEKIQQLEKSIKVNQMQESNQFIYNQIINYLYFMTNVDSNKKGDLHYHSCIKECLCQYGINDHLPIILIHISQEKDFSFLREFFSFYEYAKKHLIYFHVMIIKSYEAPISYPYIKDPFIHVIKTVDIDIERKVLLKNIATIIFNPNGLSFSDQVSSLREKFIDQPIYYQLDYSAGNFIQRLNTKNTSSRLADNRLSNQHFSSYLNDKGYSFSMFNQCILTSEFLYHHSSEGIKINDRFICFRLITHKKDYSILEGENDTVKYVLTEFVAREENVKIFLLKVINKYKNKRKLDLSFYLNPVISHHESDRSYIISRFRHNYLNLQNPCSKDHYLHLFVSSNLKIQSVNITDPLYKSVTTSLFLDRSSEVVFLLGCSQSDEKTTKLISKYSNLLEVKHELQAIKR